MLAWLLAILFAALLLAAITHKPRDMYVASIFFFIIGIAAVLPSAIFIHQHSFFDKMQGNIRLPLWEHCAYYFMAAYPIISYILLVSSDGLFTSSGIPKELVRHQFAIYVTCHIPLTILSLTVVRHLIKRSRLNIIFAITGSIAGGMYVAAGLVLMMK